MAKTTIRELPSTLKHVRLYLDDILEAQAIFQEAVDETSNRAPLTFAYQVGEFRFEHIDDLIDHGGCSSDFKLLIQRGSTSEPTSVLTLSGTNEPYVRTYALGLGQAQQWAVFARIDQLFTRRMDKVKRTADAFPPMKAAVMMFLLSASFQIFPKLSLSKPVWNSIGIIALSCFSLFAFSMYGAYRTSKVFFSYSRSDERAQAQAWKERREKLGWLLCGAVLTLGIQWLAKKL